MEKRLGKISSATFGYGGYQDAQFGLSIGIEAPGWGVGDFKGAWSTDIKVDKHTQWTEEDRSKHFADTMRFLNDLLRKAKVRDVSKLRGIPVEVEFDGTLLKSWRILEEVL